MKGPLRCITALLLLATPYCLISLYGTSSNNAFTAKMSWEEGDDPEPELTLAPDGETDESHLWELEQRRIRVSRVCEEYGLNGPGNGSLHRPNAWEFLINLQHRLQWCNIFKAASSSWLYVYNLLAGFDAKYLARSKKSPISLARQRYPRPEVHELNEALRLPNAMSFLIVREPFERLLSAYRNKLENFRHRFYLPTARLIMNRYRQKEGRPPVKGPTFSEFVNYLIELHKKGKKFDEHWAPYYKFCTPCQVSFTVIAKTETLEADQRYIMNRANISSLVQPQKMNVSSGSETRALLKHYYSQLSLPQLQELYDIYKIDFEMFGYDASEYFQYVLPQS